MSAADLGDGRPLSESLPGTWQLVSRVDVDDAGQVVEEPTLGSDPIALFFVDRHGHFGAQFMRREPPGPDASTGRPVASPARRRLRHGDA